MYCNPLDPFHFVSNHLMNIDLLKYSTRTSPSFKTFMHTSLDFLQSRSCSHVTFFLPVSHCLGPFSCPHRIVSMDSMSDRSNHLPTPITAGLFIDQPQAYPCIFQGRSARDQCKQTNGIGSNVEIFESLASLMNWDVTFRRATSYGSIATNQSIVGLGLAGMVQRGECNISANLMAINPSSASHLDYTYPITYLRFGLLAHPPQPTDISLLIIKPFHFTVWIGVAWLMAISYVGIFVAEKYKLTESRRLLRDGSVAWLTFFICAAYSSLIKACLLRRRDALPFENLEQLLRHTLDHNGSYVLLSEYNYWSGGKTDFVASGTLGDLGRRAKERGLIIVNKNVTFQLQRFARSPQYVFWGDESRMYKGMIEAPGSVALFEDDFTQNSWLAFALTKNSEWTSKVNKLIPLFFEFASRTMTRYAEEFSMSTMSRDAELAPKVVDVDALRIPLSLGVLQGAGLAYLIGIGSAILGLVVERCVGWVMKRRKRVLP